MLSFKPGDGDRLEIIFPMSEEYTAQILATNDEAAPPFLELQAALDAQLAKTEYGTLPIHGRTERSWLAHGAGPLDIAIIVLDDAGRVITAAAMAKWIARSPRVRALVSAVADSIKEVNENNNRYYETFRPRIGDEPIDPLLLRQWLEADPRDPDAEE